MKTKIKRIWKSRPVVFIPNNLDLDEHITVIQPFKEFKLEKAEYILGLIFEIPACNKDIVDKDGFVPINAKTLESVVWDYAKYLNYFIESNVIETDGYYVNNEKSRAYRYTEEYNTQVKAIIRIKEYSGCNHIKFVRGKKKYAHLFKWFNDDLDIDFEAAVNFLQFELENELNMGKMERRDIIDRFNRSLVNVFKIHYRRYNVKVDENISRLHSPLTNLRSNLRTFLRYKGEKLASIDIRNSQPYFSSRLFDLDFWDNARQKNEGSGYDYKVGIKDIVSKRCNISIEEVIVYIMIWKSNETQYRVEFDKYITLLLEGQLYEYFQPILIEELGPEYIDRTLVKRQILMCLYSDNKYFKHEKAATKRIFKQHFPNVYDLFATIKQRDKRHLSWILQRIESMAMLEVITKKIATERPELPLFTIHDSIMTTEGNEGYVAEILESELTTLIGYAPTVEIVNDTKNRQTEEETNIQQSHTLPTDFTPCFYPIYEPSLEPLPPK